MKGIIFLLLCCIVFVAGAQKKEIVFGELDTTGISKITPGAMWGKRTWIEDFVKKGILCQGCDTLILKNDCFILFAKGENNPLDRNYIVIPKGDTILIKDEKRYYHRCGNEIASMRPVNNFLSMVADTIDNKIILRDTIYVPTPRSEEVSAGGVSINFFVNSFNQTAQKDSTQTTALPAPEKKKKIIPKIIGGVIIAGLATGVTYLLLKDKKGGNPGGAPVTPEKGGPGGSPVTVGFLFPLRF